MHIFPHFPTEFFWTLCSFWCYNAVAISSPSFRPLQHAPHKLYMAVGDEVAQPASFSAQLGFWPLCGFSLVS